VEHAALDFGKPSAQARRRFGISPNRRLVEQREIETAARISRRCCASVATARGGQYERERNGNRDPSSRAGGGRFHPFFRRGVSMVAGHSLFQLTGLNAATRKPRRNSRYPTSAAS